MQNYSLTIRKEEETKEGGKEGGRKGREKGGKEETHIHWKR